LSDCGSTNGTFHFVDGAKNTVRQSFVEIDDTVCLGEFEISVRSLLNKLPKKTGHGESSNLPPKKDQIKGPVMRDIETGEILKDR
jgi:hypothetical protein